MNLNFASALATLGADAVVRIANAVRPAASYLFGSLLPERNRASYDAKAGTMTVRATMAGMVGMDSPYPPTGIVEASTFAEGTAKIANMVALPEAAIRELQALLALGGNGTGTVDQVQEALNFLDKAVLQPHIDTAEYLRGEALVYGAIDWTFNQKRLQVSYGVPVANLLTNRTGTDAWFDTASAFWADIRSLQSLLRYNVAAFIAHPTTINTILDNTVNAVAVTAQEGSTFSIRKYTNTTTGLLSTDARDSVTLIGYDKEGEILDPANPGQTIKVPFMPLGKILAIGRADNPGYRVGQGSTDDPTDALAIGYTHIGPTVENGGAPGRWADVRSPDERPWALEGRGVSNIMPVIEAPQKIAVASSDLS